MLRHLAVTVIESEPGHFHWILMESADDGEPWIGFATSHESYGLWLDAYDTGTVELRMFVDDERVGPQSI